MKVMLDSPVFSYFRKRSLSTGHVHEFRLAFSKVNIGEHLGPTRLSGAQSCAGQGNVRWRHSARWLPPSGACPPPPGTWGWSVATRCFRGFAFFSPTNSVFQIPQILVPGDIFFFLRSKEQNLPVLLEWKQVSPA